MSGVRRRVQRRAIARRWLLAWADDGPAAHLEGGPSALRAAMRAFIDGYRAALTDRPLDRPPVAAPVAAPVDDPFAEAFAIEGAGMALAALDALAPADPSALAPALGDPARDVLLALGAGMARARLDRAGATRGLPPALDGAARDGYGFFVGLFRRAEARGWADVDPDRDRGVGRSLWFGSGGRPAIIAGEIERLPPPRRFAAWTGVGLAAVFAGGGEADAQRTLRALGPPAALDAGAEQARALRRALAATDDRRDVSAIQWRRYPLEEHRGDPHETA